MQRVINSGSSKEIWYFGVHLRLKIGIKTDSSYKEGHECTHKISKILCFACGLS